MFPTIRAVPLISNAGGVLACRVVCRCRCDRFVECRHKIHTRRFGHEMAGETRVGRSESACPCQWCVICVVGGVCEMIFTRAGQVHTL
jgi:hypothetical protein